MRERDWVVVGATPAALLDLGYRQVGHDFPVFLHPLSGEEYALARTERKSGPGHLGFVCDAGADVTLEDDLLRRDLTINALARADDGRLIDPRGGRRDLDKRVLRHVSHAFVEDPLRVFRVARFAAELAPYDFQVAPETRSLMAQMAGGGDLDELAGERVWLELMKAMAAAEPARFFGVLASCDALVHWFAELAQSVGRLAALFAPFDNALDRFGAFGWVLAEHEIEALCGRLKSPSEHRRLALAVANHGRLLADWREHAAPEVLVAIKAAGGLRQQEWFERVVSVIEACGAVSLKELRALVDKLRAVSPERHRQRGLEGSALGDALRRDMLELIASCSSG